MELVTDFSMRKFAESVSMNKIPLSVSPGKIVWFGSYSDVDDIFQM